jgi:hypothetical protein
MALLSQDGKSCGDHPRSFDELTVTFDVCLLLHVRTFI